LNILFNLQPDKQNTPTEDKHTCFLMGWI